jgi:hypothetical protein
MSSPTSVEKKEAETNSFWSFFTIRRIRLILGIMLAYLIFSQALPWLRSRIPDPAIEKTKLEQESHEIFEESVSKIDKGLPIRKRTKMTQALEAEMNGNKYAIHNTVKSCPSDYKYDKEEGKITFDVTECDKGQIIWLGLFSEYKAQVYSVTLYKYGRHGTENVQVAARPVIKVMSEKEPDGFSLATPLSGEDVIFPFDYTLRGRVKFVVVGNADLVEMVLRK